MRFYTTAGPSYILSRWNAQGYILSKAKNIRLFMEKRQYEETREEHHPLSTFTGHVKPWTKEFQWYVPSVIMINMRTGLPFKLKA